MSSTRSAPPSLAGRYFVEQFVPSLLNQVTNGMNQRFKVALRRFDLSISQWRALAALSTGERLSLTEITELTAIGQATLSRVIDQLLDRQLVTSAPRASDGRFVEISLAPAGHELLMQVWPVAWQHSELALADLDDEEEAELRRLLMKIVGTLRAR